MIDEALRKLIEFLEVASPATWEVLVKQVYVEAIASLAWAIGLSVAAYFLFKLGAYARKEYEDDYMSGWDLGAVFSYIAFGVCVAIAFGLFVEFAMHIINPEFYAIRYIISQFK